MMGFKKGLMFALFLAGTTAFAQQRMDSHQNDFDTLELKPQNILLEKLDLSEEQKAKLKLIDTEYAQKDSLALLEFHQKNEQSRISRMKDFKSVLSKEQLIKFEDMQLMRADREIFSKGVKPEKREKVEKVNHRSVKVAHKQKHHGKQNAKKGKSKHDLKKANPEKKSAQGKSVEMSDHREFRRLNPEEHAEKQILKLTKELRLSGPQANEIYKICLKWARIKAETGNDKKKQKHKEVRKVLDDEQRAYYDEFIIGDGYDSN